MCDGGGRGGGERSGGGTLPNKVASDWSPAIKLECWKFNEGNWKWEISAREILSISG